MSQLALSDPPDIQTRSERVRRAAKVVIPVLIFGIAAWVLYDLTQEVRWSDVTAAIAAMPYDRLFLAIGFTVASFALLAAYEVLAVKIVAPGRVRPHIAATAGAVSYAISNLLGFSFLTGGALRYRIYAAEGLDLATVSGVFATSWITLWAGIFVITGVALLLDPTGVPLLSGLSPTEIRLMGISLLAAVAAFLVWVASAERRVRFRAFDLPMPSLHQAGLQILAASLDLTCAALACYVLLPSGISAGFAGFFLVFTVATAAGLLGHTPGGLGTFEAVMLFGLGATARADLLAGLLLYRLVYFVLPFSVATVTLCAAALRSQEVRLKKGGETLIGALRLLVPPLAASVAFIAGIVLLISGALPAELDRIEILRDILPLSVIELSHLAGSVVGVSLLVIARGLYRRMHRAWVLTLVLLAAGAVASLLKGVDYEEAFVLSAGAMILVALRPAFYRRASLDAFKLSPGWLLSILMTIVAALWLGFFAYRHVYYAHELWWQFTWDGNAPRFLRAAVAVAVATLAFGLNSWLSWRRPEATPEAIPDDVRRLVAEARWSEANLALVGDKRFLVAPEQSAFVMYAASGGSLVAMGDPVGEADAGLRLAWDFRELADRAGLRCAFYGVGTRNLPAYLDMDLSLLKLGEVARVNLETFSLEGADNRDFRHARNRAERDGLSFSILPAAEVGPHLAELRAISDAWLAHKQGREKGFALGNFDGAYLRNFDHALLRGRDGMILAFATLWRAADREELSIDLMRYRPAGPRILMDALFTEILLYGQAEGYRWFNLGAAPFAGLSDHRLTTTWNRFGRMLYRHGEEIYGFEGLRAFKQKFRPVWTPHYLACPGGLATPRVLLDINTLVSGGLRGLARL